jgi:hypothetical protein
MAANFRSMRSSFRASEGVIQVSEKSGTNGNFNYFYLQVKVKG